MGILLQIVFGILVILVFLVVYYNFKFTNHLRYNHALVWEKLHKPTWVPNSSKEDQLLLKEFLDNKAYLDLKDPVLNSMIDLKKKISLWCIMVLFLYGGMFLAFVFKR